LCGRGHRDGAERLHTRRRHENPACLPHKKTLIHFPTLIASSRFEYAAIAFIDYDVVYSLGVIAPSRRGLEK
jgi:hypothetical protein